MPQILLAFIVAAVSLVTGPLSTAHALSEFGDIDKISNESFRRRFGLKGELFILDSSGKKLVSPTSDIHEWRPGIQSKEIEAFWRTRFKGIRNVEVHSTWTLNDDNSINVTIKQYDKIESDKEDRKKKFGKVIREETFVLENFAPVSFVAEEGKEFRVVLRFTPMIDAVREGQGLDKISIGGDRGSFLVTDNQGYLWGENVRMGGVVSGLSSHRGSFVISLYPFKGAKEIGFAKEKTIELNLTDKLRVTIRNEEIIVPGDGLEKVYGYYLPNFKMSRPNSVYSFGQQTVEAIPPEFVKK